ncbi:hypothetical protein JCM10296v2_006087 [Rhodotorula toruloides]
MNLARCHGGIATVKAKKLVKAEVSVRDFCRNRGFENFEIRRLDLVAGNRLCDIRSSEGTVVCVNLDALESEFDEVEPSRETMSRLQLQLHILKERDRATQARLDRQDEEKAEGLTIEIAQNSLIALTLQGGLAPNATDAEIRIARRELYELAPRFWLDLHTSFSDKRESFPMLDKQFIDSLQNLDSSILPSNPLLRAIHRIVFSDKLLEMNRRRNEAAHPSATSQQIQSLLRAAGVSQVLAQTTTGRLLQSSLRTDTPVDPSPYIAAITSEWV